jgi:hypothetical protein
VFFVAKKSSPDFPFPRLFALFRSGKSFLSSGSLPPVCSVAQCLRERKFYSFSIPIPDPDASGEAPMGEAD